MLGKINDYNQLDLIGKGGFGDVYLVESVDKHQYALKLIPVTKDNKQDAKKQAQMYVKLQHPNILKAREYFYYSQERFLAIVLEYCPDGSLVNLIGQINQIEIKRIMTQIVEGLIYIHSQKIIHRDIKPENILMMKGEPKITDLGLAQIMKSSGLSGKSGTPFYEAPQVLYEEKYSQAADIWSLGILFLEVLLGQRIFKLVKGTLPPGIREGFPFQSLLDEINNEQLREIVKKMLTKKPSERLSLKDLLNCLNGKKKQEHEIQRKFSQSKKSNNIKLTNNNFTANISEWKRSIELALVEGDVFKKGSSIRFRINQVGQIVGVGLGIRNVIAANSYQFKIVKSICSKTKFNQIDQTGRIICYDKDEIQNTQHYPIEKSSKIAEQIPFEHRIEYIPFQNKLIKYSNGISTQVAYYGYYAIEYLRQYIPQYFHKVDRQRKKIIESIRYLPVETQIIHYPEQRSEVNFRPSKPKGYVQGKQKFDFKNGKARQTTVGQQQFTGSQNKLNPIKVEDIGHGCFLILFMGLSFSHSNNQNDQVQTYFRYGKGDVIRVETNGDELLFWNEINKKYFKLKIRLTEQEWNQASFCVCLRGWGASVSIQ